MVSLAESDPRLSGVEYQLSKVRSIVVVLSTKGGVGKSTIAALLGLALADKGYTVGLLDVDFANPTLHVILGVPARVELEEVMGVKPYKVDKNLYMLSPVFFAGDTSLPLRGQEDVDALLEILTIGNWGSLDTLVIDTPPGLGDTQLSLFKILKSVAPGRVGAVAVTTPSILSVRSLERSLPIVEEILSRKPMVIINMAGEETVKAAISGYDVAGIVRFDEKLEEALGSPGKLRVTRAYSDVASVAERITPLQCSQAS